MKLYDDVRRIKLEEVAGLSDRRKELLQRCAAAPPSRSLIAALRRTDPAIIAEVKRASPSKGEIAPDVDAVALARGYVRGGAAAISVLTEQVYFRGSLADLAAVREAVPVPVLRKDFLLDPLQVLAARAHGADAVLLIVGFLEDHALRSLLSATGDAGMEALVEVHDERELDRARAVGAELIGINNRDLRTLRVDLATAERLMPLTPPGCHVVVESGIHGVADRDRLRRCGARAFLIGEYFVRSEDPEMRVRELVNRAE
jgi:indole-3-glycerol phosphate synthase